MDEKALIHAHQEKLLEGIREYFGENGLSARVRQAFFDVPRHLFVDRYREYGSSEWKRVDETTLWQHLPALYRNDGLGIHGSDEEDAVATISQPQFVLSMVEQLDLEPGMRVLEIGTGSGWNAGLLGSLVSPGGVVDSIEIIPALGRHARHAITKAGLTNVRVVTADGGRPPSGLELYDRVVFTAGAYDLPEYLYHRVREDGILLFVLRCPGGGELLVRFRKRADCFESDGMRFCRFVPLTGHSRLLDLDPVSLDSFEPWHRLRDQLFEQRQFYAGGRGPEGFEARTNPVRSYLAVVERRMQWFTTGFGLWLRDQNSLALITPDRFSVYGAPPAGDVLNGHLERWLAHGMPSMATMSVRAFAAGTAPAQADGEYVTLRPESHFLWKL